MIVSNNLQIVFFKRRLSLGLYSKAFMNCNNFSLDAFSQLRSYIFKVFNANNC